MFKKTQKYLLVNNPLLWNMKIVPAVCFAMVFHVVFFLIGYANGKIDFTAERDYDITDGIVIFFSVLVTLLFFVIWFVFYFRNNAYKSFYHLRPNHLFKEWLLLLLVCLLNVSYSISFVTGKTLRVRSYYSYEETLRRCDIIDDASTFITSEYDYVRPVNEDGTFNPDSTFTYNKVRYPYNSLMNKSGESFYIDWDDKKHTDIHLLMQKNDTAAVKKMMTDYLAIAHEHGLKGNVNVEKWFALTYHYPEFTEYELIGRGNETETIIENGVAQAVKPTYKYFLPQEMLADNYEILARNWIKPIIPDESIYLILYLSLGLSVFFFAFKATNIRSWIISIIGSGLLFVVMGIMATIFRSESVFLVYWLALSAVFTTHFFVKLYGRQDKGFSGISLNLMLWSLPAFLPLVYGLVMEIFDHVTYLKQPDGTTKIFNTPQHDWLEANLGIFIFINILLVIAMMGFLTTQIRRWKALAEN